jgi:serine/threonine protein kinase
MHGETTQASGRELQVGDVFADHRIEGVLGRGGMGVVYRATDTRLKRPVALKIIKPELSGDDDFRRRFRRESEHAASIRQANVVTIYQAGEADHRLFVTMDLIDGTDLREVVRGHGRLDLVTACEITDQIAAALDAAHGRGLVHRDVKPANVLVANGAPLHVFLTDFGLTKHASSQTGITKSGLFIGTLDYAAPEQIQGWPVDARADVYALGCVLFEMLTGAPPFRRGNDYGTLYAHMTEQPPRASEAMPGVPVAFDDVIARALAKDPDDRYPSAGDLARAAQAAAEGHRPAEPERTVAIGSAAPAAAPVAEPPTQAGGTPVTAAIPAAAAPPPPPPPPQAPMYYEPPKSSNPWPVIALIVAILVAGGVAVAVLMTRGGDDGGSDRPSTQQRDAQQQPQQQQQDPTTPQKPERRTQPAVDPQLRADVREFEQILSDSAEGRRFSSQGDYRSAADNRSVLLNQLDAMDPHADLTRAHALLRNAIEASLQANLEHEDCGCTDQQPSDVTASEFKQDFVEEFNPIARDILGQSYSADDI